MAVKSILARVLIPLIEMRDSDFSVTDCAFSQEETTLVLTVFFPL